MYHVLHEEEMSPVRKRSDPAVPCQPVFWGRTKGSRRWQWRHGQRIYIVCLPVDYHSRSQELLIPRGSRRTQLAKAGLIGKMLLSSAMSEADTRAEISSVFSVAFDEEKNFPFNFLQTIGGGSWCLTVPCTSPSFSGQPRIWCPQLGKVPHTF